MRKIALLFFLLCCIGLNLTTWAQEKENRKNDSHYLVGAIPEVDGKVVFTKEFNIPGMNQEEIYDRILHWMEGFLKKNKNNSRILFADKERGQIVGLGEEWIVFQSNAISLDRTEIKYQLTAICQPEVCTLKMEKIRFEYREGEEMYTAEEWIVDKYALNKSKTKLIRGLAKWRRKTVDFVDNLAKEVTEALSAIQKPSENQEIVTEQPQKKTEGTIVIAPQQKITINRPVEEKTSAIATPKPIAKPTTSDYKEVNPTELSSDLIQMGTGKLVIVIGSDEFNMTMMTANAGGSLGKMSGKTVIFSFLSPDQPFEAIENAENYTVRFYPAGQNKPSVILECKKIPTQAPLEGQPRMYIGEILKAKIN